MTKTIVKRETRYAVHLPKNQYREDAHYVKEQVTYEDGTTLPRTFLVKDFARPVWCSKKAYTNYSQKREFAPIEELNERMTTQSAINQTVAGLLESPYLANQPNAIKNSPFVYGYDQTSTSFIKLKSLTTNNFIQTPYSVAVMDTETDIETREILIATIAFEDKVHVTLLRRYLTGRIGIDEKVAAGVKRYLPQYHGKLKIQITVHDDEVDMLKAVFKTANEWAPDFLTFWNIFFDVGRVLERLKVAGVNPVDVICDQSIPRAYRYVHFKEGPTKKEMASGKKMPIKPSLQWHTLFSTTKFHAIDSMCVYRQIRIAKQELPSYSLDAVLQKELGSRKLQFEEAEAYKGAKWHMFMQQEYPIEYIVYNIYDCLGVLELDKVTKDLSMSLPSGAGMTDFSRFNSNPKKIVDALYIFAKERGRIVGTVPKIEKEEAEVEADELGDDAVDADDEDDDDDGIEDPTKYSSLNLKGWIQLLPQNLLLSEGLKCLEDFPDVVTNVRGAVWDVDATAAYPTCTMVANVSKETCVNELIEIEGIGEEVFREQNLSMCLGGVNTLEYFSVMFGMPSLEQIDKLLED